MPAVDHVTDNTSSVVSVPSLTVVDAERITAAVAGSKAENTRRTYVSDWRRFESWCATSGHQTLPAHPATIAAYISAAAAVRTPAGERAYAPSTLSRWVAAIGHRHRSAGHPNPASAELVVATLSGIRRACAAAGERPTKQVAPLLTEAVVAMVIAARRQCESWSDRVYARRDAALLLLGYTGAFRRSELVGLRLGDVTARRLDGLHVRLRKSKTDQDGAGTIRALPYGAAPVRWHHRAAFRN